MSRRRGPDPRERGRQFAFIAWRSSCLLQFPDVVVVFVAVVANETRAKGGSITFSSRPEPMHILYSIDMPMPDCIYTKPIFTWNLTKTDSTRCNLLLFLLMLLQRDDAINEMSSSSRVCFFFCSSLFSLFCAWIRFVRSFVVLFGVYKICNFYYTKSRESWEFLETNLWLFSRHFILFATFPSTQTLYVSYY